MCRRPADGPVLLTRHGSRQLTPEGKSLAQFARPILALNDEALASLRQPSVAGRVRLGAPHEYTASLLPEFLGKFAQSHPNVLLEVTSDLSKNLLRRQQNGEFDLIIALHDESSPPDGRRIFTEPLVWITSADHARHEQDPLPLVVAPPPCIPHGTTEAIVRLEKDISESFADGGLSWDGGVGKVRRKGE